MLDQVSCCQSSQIYGVVKQKNPIMAYAHTIHQPYGPSFNLQYSYLKKAAFPSFAINCRRNDYSLVPKLFHNGATVLMSRVVGWNGNYWSNHKPVRRERLKVHAVDVAAAVDVINDLGLDTLTFLAVTVLVVPVFRSIKASPILGFFFAGIVLSQFGAIRNLTDVKILSEWGILFLLFEMGLELSFARLKALAKFAFGMGLTQKKESTDDQQKNKLKQNKRASKKQLQDRAPVVGIKKGHLKEKKLRDIRLKRNIKHNKVPNIYPMPLNTYKAPPIPLKPDKPNRSYKPGRPKKMPSIMKRG